jgi:UDP-N-acetylmuramoyl-tripeptide--D-alanyl-D-alanine ligase
MDAVTLEELAAMCGGRPPEISPRTMVRRISKDTRTLVPGDLYFALRGEAFDGNSFAAEAARRGAAAAVLEKAPPDVPPDFPVIVVDDGLAALRRLASSWRDRLGLRAVGVTGSNGKTSTKEFTAAVLGARFRTIKTEGNLNNHIGLPLSILSASVKDEAAVWEIGMNHPGEIAPLAALARPEVGIITHIGVAHIEHLGSRGAIAKEKGALLEALPPHGTAVIPAGDDFADALAARTRAEVWRVGRADSRVRAEGLEVAGDGTQFWLVADEKRLRCRLAVPGAHMVGNALLAVAAGMAHGISPEECVEGLARARGVAGRLACREIRGIRFLDDTYNANPDSMVAALGVLRDMPATGRRFAVLGAMGELGDHTEDGLRRVGAASATCADTLVSVGAATHSMAEAARSAGLASVVEVEDTSAAAALLREHTAAGDIVLVKGSRSAQTEIIIEKF